jgi:hypothetical protein
MPCNCNKRPNGFLRGSVTGYTVTSDGGCLIAFDGVCVVFASPGAAEAAAIEHGFAEWRLTPVTV